MLSNRTHSERHGRIPGVKQRQFTWRKRTQCLPRALHSRWGCFNSGAERMWRCCLDHKFDTLVVIDVEAVIRHSWGTRCRPPRQGWSSPLVFADRPPSVGSTLFHNRGDHSVWALPCFWMPNSQQIRQKRSDKFGRSALHTWDRHVHQCVSSKHRNSISVAS